MEKEHRPGENTPLPEEVRKTDLSGLSKSKKVTLGAAVAAVFALVLAILGKVLGIDK